MSDNVCPITQEEIVMPLRLFCGHMFEETAINQWLRGSDTCPVCRAVIVTSPRRRNRHRHSGRLWYVTPSGSDNDSAESSDWNLNETMPSLTQEERDRVFHPIQAYERQMTINSSIIRSRSPTAADSNRIAVIVRFRRFLLHDLDFSDESSSFLTNRYFGEGRGQEEIRQIDFYQVFNGLRNGDRQNMYYNRDRTIILEKLRMIKRKLLLNSYDFGSDGEHNAEDFCDRLLCEIDTYYSYIICCLGDDGRRERQTESSRDRSEARRNLVRTLASGNPSHYSRAGELADELAEVWGGYSQIPQG